MEDLRITKVEATEVSNLVGIYENGGCQVEIPESVEFEEIPLKKPGSLNVSSKMEDNVVLYSTKLVFETCRWPELKSGRTAFRCKTASGQTVLIGNGNRPYPTIEVQRNISKDVTSTQMVEVTVNLKAVYQSVI
ncbi:MAG: hypothetical protein ACI3Y0_04980 [Prevotella sp.]